MTRLDSAGEEKNPNGPRESIGYLELLHGYLYENWLETQDEETKEEVARLAAEIAQLRNHRPSFAAAVAN